ncbi:type VI secretion system domain-containing protein (plasmid) [Bradyrhizobium sp. CCGUVB1N3]|uniref:type VI secretion system domain-containing protein n=1 Tax=Bradyrhizobium sp. CCGUVB1N3 TaxID=2949629 RepID=UPI0020B33FD5|nr:type VI secretion system domain-containing protein [Bradyrhizobium sp. CCGUVB1N3]MCP3477694.1 type VI secretion system domain-containing protein [Bradyrhizobium sp. CCGUVB1N3]
MAETAATEADYPAVLAAYEALDDLDRQFGEKLINEQVALGELFRALKPHYEEAKRAAAEAAGRMADAVGAAEETSAAPAEAAPPVDGAQRAAPPLAVLGGVDGDWAEFTLRLPDMLRQAAAAMRVASPTNPKAYLLNRVGSWMRFDALPPESGGRTAVFPPGDSIVVNADRNLTPQSVHLVG